ncbi:secreted protein [sediment metagenome]|uniref:Secreted protein n=1 Tax=sediment metagenome TaxID=749907 RepID=D9PHB9_9ZZZZ
MNRKLWACLTSLAIIFVLVSEGRSEDKAEEKIVSGMIVVHEETGDIKVVTKNYEYVTVYFDKKSKVEATVKASMEDLAQETSNLPNGTVIFVMENGKPVAKKISYKAKANWVIDKTKKKESDE